MHFQQYFSYVLAVSVIGGGNRSTQRKPQTCRKSLTNIITVTHNVVSSTPGHDGHGSVTHICLESLYKGGSAGL